LVLSALMLVMIPKKRIVIVGAGPAGLTAAYELAKTKKYKVTIIEADNQVGGISKTVNHQGNLIDIGGHRFFSNSPRVLDWWTQFLPVVDATSHVEITYQQKSHSLDSILLKNSENALLVRTRKSRILYKNKLLDYPLKLNLRLLVNLGLRQSYAIIKGILRARIFPIKNVQNLEDFFINNFGRELYETFFKDYTEKVWGKSCIELSADWGKQRIKSLKVREIIAHSVYKLFVPSNWVNPQARTLIEKFLYPSKGPGMLWENVASRCQEMGVELIMRGSVNHLHFKGNLVESIDYRSEDDQMHELRCDAVFSTMPIKHLIKAMDADIPPAVYRVASQLEYRDFIIVGLELHKLKLIPKEKRKIIEDNWLYIQDKGVKLGRLQIFNNWSPYMTASENAWIGAEYFCKKDDDLWRKSDQELMEFALAELQSIGILSQDDFISGKVVRCPKAYPTYTGSYHKIHLVQDFLEDKTNLFLMGRNGLHKYNNQDHSMLTAFKAVELFEKDHPSKKEIWDINADDQYIG